MTRKGKNQRRLETALKSLTPSYVGISGVTDCGELMGLIVISEAFKGMPLLKRFSLLNKILEENDKEFFETYFFCYEPVTQSEFNNKKLEI